MADEHETESKAWAIEAAAAEAASRAAEEMHRPPVVPMERVVDRTDIERGERAGQKRSQEPGFPRFFAELNLGLILTAFAIVAFKTPNHFTMRRLTPATSRPVIAARRSVTRALTSSKIAGA